MSDRRHSSSFDEFETDAILDAVRDAAGEELRAFVEYDAETYNVLLLTDDARERFDDPDAIEEFADRLHGNYRLDFTEKEMYEDVYGELGTVRAFAVFFEANAVFRFVGDTTGFYVSLGLDAPFNRVIDAVYEVIEE